LQQKIYWSHSWIQWRRSLWGPWGLSLTWISALEAEPHLILEWILLVFICRICYVKHLTHSATYSHIYLCYSLIHLYLMFLSFLYSVIAQIIGGGAIDAQRLKPRLVFANWSSASLNFDLDVPQQYIVSKPLKKFDRQGSTDEQKKTLWASPRFKTLHRLCLNISELIRLTMEVFVCPLKKWNVFGSNESSHRQTNKFKILATLTYRDIRI